jgi:hypothetical protein
MPVQSLGSNASYALDNGPENVVVKAIIIAELELHNVKMQVFLADVVGCADDAALDDASESLNRVGVHCANNILPLCRVNGGVRIFRHCCARSTCDEAIHLSDMLRDGLLRWRSQ